MKELLEKTGKKITDIKILKHKIVIYFNQEKIEISPETFVEFNLYINKRLKESDFKKIIDYDHFQKYLHYALNLISKYVYTNSKIKRKLLAKGASEITIKKIIDYLNEHHLIDDKIFAKDLAHDFLKRLKGPHRIVKQLKTLGVKEEIIISVIKELDEKTIIANLITRIKTLDKRYQNDINKKSKIVRSLVNDGYSLKMIEDAICTMKLSINDRHKAIRCDYLKCARRYENKEKIINALKRKGYYYSEINAILKEQQHDFY